MIRDEKGLMHLLAKKYTHNILKSLKERPNQRFKDLSSVCPIEKVRNQRLRELEFFELIEVNIKRFGRRPISVYSISEKGKEILKVLEQLKEILK